jgi:hypothetical protein
MDSGTCIALFLLTLFAWGVLVWLWAMWGEAKHTAIERWLIRLGAVCVGGFMLLLLTSFAVEVVEGGKPYLVDPQGRYLLILKGNTHPVNRGTYEFMQRLDRSVQLTMPALAVGAVCFGTCAFAEKWRGRKSAPVDQGTR